MSSSVQAQGWHPNPMLMQPPPPQPPAAPPPGWMGTWPPNNVSFPPGFPGPPPAPSNVGVHPHWGAGYWQFNPHAPTVQNGQSSQPQFWAPGMGWFPNQNQNINPYKRVPKPPSPSYWNTKLSDNGLGLEGMVKRRDPSEYDGQEPHTPWIWNPPSLLESGDRATPTRDFNPRRTGSLESSSLRNTSTPTRDGHSSGRGVPPQEGSSTHHTHSQTPQRSSSVRGDYFYGSRASAQDTPTHAAPSGPLRQSSEPVVGSAGPSASTPGHRSVAHVPPYPAPTPTSTNTHSRSAPAHQTVFSQEPESFTSSRELQPTFSANIIRTPTHYHQGRRSTDEAPSSHYSRSPSATGHSSTPSRPETLTRQGSLPNPPPSSRDMYSNFVEDMSSSLTSTTPSRTRGASGATAPLSRSRTEPLLGANLTTIHESSSSTASSGEQFFAPLPDPLTSSPSESSPDPSPRPRARRSPYESGHQTPERSPLYRDRDRDRDRERDRRPSPYASRISPSPSPHTHPTTHPYSSGSSRRDNPLPPPPVERPSLEFSRPPVQEPAPAHYSRKVRMGLWNRRGDYLTPNSFVVYAPEDRAYPEELEDYPDEREGYMDQHGTYVPWLESRPELPASLPCRGRPPAQPYEIFVVYAYLA